MTRPLHHGRRTRHDPDPQEVPEGGPALRRRAPRSACRPRGGAPALVHAAGGTLRIGIPSDIQQIDPHLVSSAIDYTPMEAMFESLTTFDRAMNPAPSLAEKWDQPDSRTYVFTLRRGVKYHSGREVKAADVKWSFERIMAFGGKSKWASYLADIATIEPLDDLRVRINLKNPSAPFLSNLRYAAIVPPEAEKNLAHPAGRHRALPLRGAGPQRPRQGGPLRRLLERRDVRYVGRDRASAGARGPDRGGEPPGRRRSTSTTTSPRSSRPSWTRPRTCGSTSPSHSPPTTC